MDRRAVFYRLFMCQTNSSMSRKFSLREEENELEPCFLSVSSVWARSCRSICSYQRICMQFSWRLYARAAQTQSAIMCKHMQTHINHYLFLHDGLISYSTASEKMPGAFSCSPSRRSSTFLFITTSPTGPAPTTASINLIPNPEQVSCDGCAEAGIRLRTKLSYKRNEDFFITLIRPTTELHQSKKSIYFPVTACSPSLWRHTL